jgi:hypothetical protein
MTEKNIKNYRNYFKILFISSFLITAFLIIPYSVSIELNSDGETAISQAEADFNQAYESLVLSEINGLNISDLFSKLNQSLLLIQQAKFMMGVNETKAIILANNASDIAILVYNQSQEYLNYQQSFGYLNSILIWLGVSLTIIFVIIVGYYLNLRFKNKDEILESIIEPKEDEI